MASTAKTSTGTDRNDHLVWDTSYANWNPGPGDRLLRAYSDAVNERLLDRWLPDRSDHLLKTDLFDEVAGDGLVGFLLSRADRVSGIDIAQAVVESASTRHRRLEALTADVRSGRDVRCRGFHVDARPFRRRS